MNVTHMIEPENMPTWVAGGFIVALVALVVAFAAVHRANVIMVGTQTEVLALNKKIEDVKKNVTVAAAPAAPAAPVVAEQK